MILKTASDARQESIDAIAAVVNSQIAAAVQTGKQSCLVPANVLDVPGLMQDLMDKGYAVDNSNEECLTLSW